MARWAPARATKRSLDIIVGVVASVASLVIVLPLAVGALLSYGASPFFRQLRVGRGGRLVRVWKIRSLPVSTDPTADKYAIAGENNTRFGRFVRSTHLDELPQLWLVISGRMSLVGPRPEMIHLDARLSAAHAAARRPLRPGCTGLWQISKDSARLMGEVPEYDIFYAEHQSLRLDLWILWRTAMLSPRRHPISLDDVPAWARRNPAPRPVKAVPVSILDAA